MSNNAPDYNNNLAFPPRHDETAYELQLKVNKLEKENTQLRKWCEEFNALDVAKENQQLKNRIRKRNRSIKKVSDLAFERKKENKLLKELLRKCRSDLISCFAVGYEDSEFIKKIDEVLK